MSILFYYLKKEHAQYFLSLSNQALSEFGQENILINRKKSFPEAVNKTKIITIFLQVNTTSLST